MAGCIKLFIFVQKDPTSLNHADEKPSAARRRDLPLLSYCKLHLLDRIWQRQKLQKKLGASIVPYADDFVVLCKGKIDRLLAAVRYILGRLGLILNGNKTHIVDARQNSFSFLGFDIRVSKNMTTGNPYSYVCLSPKAIEKVKAHINDGAKFHASSSD